MRIAWSVLHGALVKARKGTFNPSCGVGGIVRRKIIPLWQHYSMNGSIVYHKNIVVSALVSR